MVVLLGGACQSVGRLAGGDASLPRGERLVRVDAPGPRGGTPAVLGLLGVTGRVRRIQLGLIAIRVKSNSLETEQREVYAITWNRVPVITGWQSGLAILDHFPSLHSFLEEADMEVETGWQVP